MKGFKLKVAFRVDASLNIGTGHVMRCLTLADCLRREGAICIFVCREHPGNLMGFIRQNGFQVEALVTSEKKNEALNSIKPVHADWLGTSWEDDAEQTKLALGNTVVDWLIVDHYALDASWEQSLSSCCRQLMVIDDLADRRHECDLLLNQNLGRSADDYCGQVPDKCRLLIGPLYALLRPEFVEMRPYSLARRENPQLHRILVSMGGIDKDNITGKALSALKICNLPLDSRVTVVMGSQSPALEDVRWQVGQLPWRSEILVDVRNMAVLMTECDLSIGAAGSTSWERCCLAVPSLTAVLAENQRGIASALAQAGATIHIGLAELPSFGANLVDAIASLSREPAKLQRMSSKAQALTQGNGTSLVVGVLMTKPSVRITVRPMEQKDLSVVLSWRNHPKVRKYMLTQHEISFGEHVAWFERTSSDPSSVLLMVENDGRGIGFVQFPRIRENEVCWWGFYAAPDAPRGSGQLLGRAALEFAFTDLAIKEVGGKVLDCNLASVRLHEKLGFQRDRVEADSVKIIGQNDEYIYFKLSRVDWCSRNYGRT